ncbi:protein FAM185A isoform X2 [Vulpes lagopus]|uniref:protein FAM185A isoform X2 n=1 Tax=Vulpes lagopus TaxID=494514 RepID=UPI001BCA55D2|nr:protein FAM185A isoform X2 [Vulpes lagopus]
MFARRPGCGLGGLRLTPLGVGARGAGPARPHGGGGGGGERQPGSEPPPPPGPSRGSLRAWALRVSPLGRLRARLPCHVTVRPLDPLAHPAGDRVLVALRAAEGGARAPGGLRLERGGAPTEVAVVSDALDPGASVDVSAPLQFDLNIKASGSGCVEVQNIECDNYCRIETEQGAAILQSVKSKKLHVQTKGGKVICLGTVYGNIDIHASDKSTVTIDKLQGSTVNISTEDGLLEAKYLYTESSFLSSIAGDITLGSVHGDITLQSKMGNIVVGSILVKVAPSIQAYLQLSGKEVNINSEVHVQEMTEVHKEDGVIITGLMNQASKHEKWIKADAPEGTVNVKSQSWFQSLKLQD